MRSLYLLPLLAILLVACGGSKTIYEEKNIDDKKLEKLIRDYSANPKDTALANQVTYAYNYLHNQRLAQVNQYLYSSSLDDKEQLLRAYSDLQNFYTKVKGFPSLDALLKPGSVGAEIEKTKLDLVSGHYEKALEWLNEKNWKTSRSAYRSLSKVQGWMPDYKDTKRLLKLAKDQSVINAVILPVRAEGFYYSNNNMGSGINNGPRLSEQLVRDLGGNYNNSGWYKTFNSWETSRLQNGPDWSIEPVWTRLQIDNPRTQQSDRRVEKQQEMGKDTSGKPIYKTLVATLTVYEVTYSVNGTLELRINDEANREQISRNSWYENYSFKSRWASYKGEAGALSNSDWELINAPRDNRQNEGLLEQRLLEKMYPSLLSYLRSQLSN